MFNALCPISAATSNAATVYELYELTPDEIKIVESATK